MMKSQDDKIRDMVKESYAKIAQSADCGCSADCCGTSSSPIQIFDLGQNLGYTNDQLAIGLGEANLGLGCGNPLGIADLKAGERVVDLGSGAGFDAFLAAKSVGPEGRVIGVDMTLEMISKAKKNAERLHVANVEFRLARIEKLPVADNSVDVVLSNCVINLSPDKNAVYEEMFRVVKPGGRISISDILRSGEFPREIKDNPSAYTG
jgi:SAM-dependent methyltransferase